MRTDPDYRGLSFWHETAPGRLDPRPPLRGNILVDVAIVGAGFTGLWTALSLAAADTSLRIAVLEREIAGFGASGRNGGWVSGAFPAPKAAIAAAHGRDAAIAMQRALFDSVDEVGTACLSEGIDTHYRKGGSLGVATLQPEADRFHAVLEEEHAFGFGDAACGSSNERRGARWKAGSCGPSTGACARTSSSSPRRGTGRTSRPGLEA